MSVIHFFRSRTETSVSVLGKWVKNKNRWGWWHQLIAIKLIENDVIPLYDFVTKETLKRQTLVLIKFVML